MALGMAISQLKLAIVLIEQLGTLNG